MTLKDEITRRAERIATLFFQRDDEKHRFLTEILAREMNYLIQELMPHLSDTIQDAEDSPHRAIPRPDHTH